MFSKALVDYKKIGDFQQLTPVLVGVFTEDTELYPFFRGLLIKKTFNVRSPTNSLVFVIFCFQ